jgi:hypothetical protein
MGASVVFDAKQNVALSGGESVVFHCHFYNCALQEAIEQGLGADAANVQMLAAAEAVERQLRALGGSGHGARTHELAARVFAEFGFGTLDLSRVTVRGGRATVPHSHYALGWLATRGERTTPTCHFVRGFVAASVAVAFDIASSRVQVVESACLACNAPECRFDVEVL